MLKKTKQYYIGIDLGGTKILTGLLNSRFEVCEEKKSKVDAQKGEKAFMKTIADDIKFVLDKAKLNKKHLRAIGIGCPGMIQLPQGIIQISPNISFLKNFPLREKIARSMRVPVIVENDVNAGLYGEHQFGAAKGYSEVVGIFLGTGVGGGLILNGELYRGASGAAGEIGHMLISAPSLLNHPLSGETIETQLGRLRIASEAGLLCLKQKAPALYKSVGYDIKKIKSGSLAKSIEAGDKAVLDLIVQKAQLLGASMASVVNLLSPQLIVLGGGLMEAMPEIILPEARKSMKQLAMPPLVKGVKVAAAKLQDYAIVKGAAKLAADTLNSKRRGTRA